MWRKSFCFPHWNTCSWSFCGPVSSWSGETSENPGRETGLRLHGEEKMLVQPAHSSSSHVRTANAWGSQTHRNHKRCNTFVLIYATVWGDTLGSSTDWNRNLVFEVGYYWNKILKHLPLTLALGGEKNVADFWGKY